jgi:hypothetical protein
MFVFFALSCVSEGQATAGITQKDISYNSHVYTFKILGSGMGQILKDGQVVGSIIPDGSGGERVLGLSTVTPPPDVLVAYGMYKGGASTSLLLVQGVRRQWLRESNRFSLKMLPLRLMLPRTLRLFRMGRW